MAVFKNGIFATYNGQIVTPQSNTVISTPVLNFLQITGIVDFTQRNAIYNLVADLQSYNIWDKMKAIYPFVGQAGISSSFQYNLKDARNLNEAYRLTFSPGWSFNTTGITGNGSTTYTDTNFSTANFTVPNEGHLSIYTRTDYSGLSGARVLIGNEAGTGETRITMESNLLYSSIKSTYATRINGVSTATKAFYTVTRTGSALKLFKNNTQVGNTTTVNSNTDTSIYIGASSNTGTFSTPQELSFASIGDGLTDTEAANLYTAVQRFQTTLGRQV